MSAKLMGQVWELDLPHNHQSVLLAFADHANDDGYNAFPGTGYVAWKTGYSERQTQRIIDALEEATLLLEVEASTGRRPTVYRVMVASGVRKSAYQPIRRGDRTSGRQIVGATSERRSGDIAVSPEPSKEPSTSGPLSPSEAYASEGSGPDDGGGERSGLPSTFGARNDQHALRDQRRAQALRVAPILAEVAAARKLEPATIEAIEAVMDDFPDRHHLDAADALEFWAIHGPGRRAAIRDLPSLYRKFVSNAPVVGGRRAA